MRIVLSAVISPDVTLDVVPAVLPEAPGGIALRFELYDGPILLHADRRGGRLVV